DAKMLDVAIGDSADIRVGNAKSAVGVLADFLVLACVILKVKAVRICIDKSRRADRWRFGRSPGDLCHQAVDAGKGGLKTQDKKQENGQNSSHGRRKYSGVALLAQFHMQASPYLFCF